MSGSPKKIRKHLFFGVLGLNSVSWHSGSLAPWLHNAQSDRCEMFRNVPVKFLRYDHCIEIVDSQSMENVDCVLDGELTVRQLWIVSALIMYSIRVAKARPRKPRINPKIHRILRSTLIC